MEFSVIHNIAQLESLKLYIYTLRHTERSPSPHSFLGNLEPEVMSTQPFIWKLNPIILQSKSTEALSEESSGWNRS